LWTLDTNVFVADISSELNLATYAHELVHVTQYMMGVGNFLASYFGLSLATIIKRFLMNQPIDMMESSPHESQAYEMEKRFNDWHKAKHGKYASEIKA
jgi:hypothetical protein